MNRVNEQHGDAALADQIDEALASFWRGDSAALDQLIEQEGDIDGNEDTGNLVVHALKGVTERLGHPAAIDVLPQISGYEIVRELGRGGMGVVYEALQLHPRRSVAIKVMQAAHDSDDYHRLLFKREMQALANLDHPGIATLYHAGTTDDRRSYFVMDLLRGSNLIEFAEAARLDTCAGLRLFCSLCDAVHHAHVRGVIHCDLKPSNVLVVNGEANGADTDRASIKVLDFGLARLMQGVGADLSMNLEVSRIKGTLAYMSPEYARHGRSGGCAKRCVFARRDSLRTTQRSTSHFAGRQVICGGNAPD